MACCPFHDEKTPSFYVYTEHFHCYGCGAHGDAIYWLQRRHGMTFLKALEHLTGGPIPPVLVRAASPEIPHGADNMAERVEQARRIWMESTAPPGTAADAYLRFRGVE